MLNKPVNAKLIGFVMIFAAIVLIVGTLTIGIVFIPFGLASGITPLAIIPFLLLATVTVITSFITIKIGKRYLKNKPYKQNKNLGIVILAIVSLYWVSSIISLVLSALFDNNMGLAQPIFATLIAFIFVPVSLGLKNGYTEAD